MNQLERVEKIREKTGVTYEEAKEALRKFDEACGGKQTEAKGGTGEKTEKKKKSFMDKLKETFED